MLNIECHRNKKLLYISKLYKWCLFKVIHLENSHFVCREWNMGKNLDIRENNSGTVWGNCGSLDVALWDKEIGRKVDGIL